MRPLTRAFAAAYLPLIVGLGLMARPVIGPSQTASGDVVHRARFLAEGLRALL